MIVKVEIPSDLTESKTGMKGMLADLLEREVKKEPVNGATSLTGKELRISDNGLELVQNDAKERYAVDMGVVGMNELGVDLGDGGAAPKAAHLIAQVDDSGHVQIHLEEEVGSTVCNGQSLLDQLEACEVSSSTDQSTPSQSQKAIKRAAELSDQNESSAPKKTMTNDVSLKLDDSLSGDLEKSLEVAHTEEHTEERNKEKVVNGSINGVPETANPVTVSSAYNHPLPTAAILGPNAPRTFLIVQQQSLQQARLGFPQQGQRLLLAIQRPGGVVQHVAMPANVVAITPGHLQTNGTVIPSTNSGGNTLGTRDLSNNHGQGSPGIPISVSSNLTTNSNGLPMSLGVSMSSVQSITTMASTVSSGVTTPSMEGVVTFSGGAVAFPARPTENAARNSSVAESHVTITPVLASAVANSVTSTQTSNPSPITSATGVQIPQSTLTLGNKKRSNTTEITNNAKSRGKPGKSKSTDSQPVSSPSPQPLDSSLQFMCEWKECMR